MRLLLSLILLYNISYLYIDGPLLASVSADVSNSACYCFSGVPRTKLAGNKIDGVCRLIDGQGGDCSGLRYVHGAVKGVREWGGGGVTGMDLKTRCEAAINPAERGRLTPWETDQPPTSLFC